MAATSREPTPRLELPEDIEQLPAQDQILAEQHATIESLTDQLPLATWMTVVISINKAAMAISSITVVHPFHSSTPSQAAVRSRICALHVGRQKVNVTTG